MINNKRAISNLLISLIAVVIGFMVFVLIYPNAVGDLKRQIESKASLEKYLPEKIFAAKEPVSTEAKIYSFEIVKKLLDDSYLTKQLPSPVKKGQFFLVKRDVLEDKYLIGFVEVDGEMRLYSSRDADRLFRANDLKSLQTGSAAYFEAALFDNDIDRITIRSLLNDKKFVVMSRGENKNDEPIFLYHTTGFPINNNKPNDLKDDPYYSLDKILERNVVKTFAFSTEKKSEIYYDDYQNDLEGRTIAERSNDYILIYRLDNYVVFFPQSGITATELTNKAPIEVDGNGLTSPELIDDLIREHMVVQID
ncbi:hypothetical protein JXA48_01520 [Candidatus Woesearchaeota archaeon]|nr:hypothetical protein [Candidatus Woesearchaeota archaeon]